MAVGLKSKRSSREQIMLRVRAFSFSDPSGADTPGWSWPHLFTPFTVNKSRGICLWRFMNHKQKSNVRAGRGTFARDHASTGKKDYTLEDLTAVTQIVVSLVEPVRAGRSEDV